MDKRANDATIFSFLPISATYWHGLTIKNTTGPNQSKKKKTTGTWLEEKAKKKKKTHCSKKGPQLIVYK